MVAVLVILLTEENITAEDYGLKVEPIQLLCLAVLVITLRCITVFITHYKLNFLMNHTHYINFEPNCIKKVRFHL